MRSVALGPRAPDSTFPTTAQAASLFLQTSRCPGPGKHSLSPGFVPGPPAPPASRLPSWAPTPPPLPLLAYSPSLPPPTHGHSTTPMCPIVSYPASAGKVLLLEGLSGMFQREQGSAEP